MKFLVLLLLLNLLGISMVGAIKCYQTSSTDVNYKPLMGDAVDCGNITHCYKRTVAKTYYPNLSGEDPRATIDYQALKGVYYGCAVNLCTAINADGQCYSTKEKKEYGQGKTNTCCCGTNLCNSTGLPSLFTAATVIIAVKVLF